MKNYFLYFFQEFKTHFLVLTRVKFSSPNHVMQFIDTKKKNFFFLFYSKWNTILLRERNGMKFFCIFFKDSKHIFLFWPKSNFQVLMTSWNLLTQKQENIFFNFFLQKINTNAFTLLTCKRNIRTEVSLHVS